jgi:hypothetical protein
MKNPQDMEKQMCMLQESMLKIMDAKNPQERERLTQAHRQVLRQHIRVMKDSGMMGRA